MLLLAATLSGCIHDARARGGPAVAPRALDVPVTLDLSGGFTGETLRPYIGRQITVIGHWDGGGKLSGYIYGSPESSDGEIYVRATTDSGIARQRHLENAIGDGAAVEVSGVLHWFAGARPLPVDPPYPNAVTIAPAPEHFYFDVEEAGFRFRQRKLPKP